MGLWEPAFVDREKEFSALRRFASRGSYLPLYIYGPEGCGKTRLLKEFVKRFGEGVAVYIDALERRDPSRTVAVSRYVGDVAENVRHLTQDLGAPLGAAVADRLANLLDRILERVVVRNRPLLVLVDDVVQALGREIAEKYIK